MVRNRKGSVAGRKKYKALVPQTQAGLLRGALEWFAKDWSLTELRLHGNVSWKAMHLVALGILWSWSDQATLTGAFDHARQLATAMFGQVAVTSYQGLTGAMRAYTEQLL